MKYIKVDNNFIDLNSFIKGLSYMFLEINENGLIEREIGFNINGGIIHAYPSDKYHFGKYGIFDLTPFKYKKLNSDLDLEDFEKIWNKT